MDTSSVLLVCLLGSLPGPPGVYWQDSYFQLFPIDKTKCPTIDPKRDISFNLFTPENPLQADVINVGDDTALAQSHFDFYKPTVFFFHAFFESSTSDSASLMKTAYLQRKDYNVILLQAQRMEAGPWYLTAARNTRIVGEYTATFIDYLVSRGMDINSVHLIGLSLGAQMAGVCGQNVKSGRIQRITGLDPAGPLFTKWPRSLKLDAADAEFVDIIHTDAGIFGYPRSIGHADFWPNRGQSPQPGCRLEEIKRRSPDAFLIEPLFCSHWRSYQFYAESVITPNSFLAVSCTNWGQFLRGECKDNPQVNMGLNLSPEARGNFYLQTRDVSPFSLQSEVPQRQLQHFPIPEQPKIENAQQAQAAQMHQPVNLNENKLQPLRLHVEPAQHQIYYAASIQREPEHRQLSYAEINTPSLSKLPEHHQQQQQQMYQQLPPSPQQHQSPAAPDFSSANRGSHQRSPNLSLQNFYYYQK